MTFPVRSHRTRFSDQKRDLQTRSDVRMQRARGDFERAAAQGHEASTHGRAAVGFGVHALQASARVVGGTASAAGLAAAAVLVQATQAVGGVLARAVQGAGRAFIGIGNAIARFCGAPQIVTRTLDEPHGGRAVSGALLRGAGDAVNSAAAALERSLRDLVGCGRKLGAAARSLTGAARDLVRTAQNAGAAGALRAARFALQAAEAAEHAARHGLDQGGALLQRAGCAIIDAANAMTGPCGPKVLVTPIR